MTPGQCDRVGFGVYFTTDKNAATKIANLHNNPGAPKPGCVVTFQVNLGQRCKNLWDEETGAFLQSLWRGCDAVTVVFQTELHGLHRATTRAMRTIPSG
jgi:hypothetical protein